MPMILNRRPSAVQIFTFRDDGKVPNSHLPVVFCQGAFDFGPHPPSGPDVRMAFQPYLDRNGWKLDWVEEDAVFRYTHFHSTAHEVLAVLGHAAKLRLGGDIGIEINVRPGDLIAIPAGVAHQRLTRDPLFRVAGLYPVNNKKWDLLQKNSQDYATAKRNLLSVMLPAADPFYGMEDTAPLAWHWKL